MMFKAINLGAIIKGPVVQIYEKESEPVRKGGN